MAGACARRIRLRTENLVAKGFVSGRNNDVQRAGATKVGINAKGHGRLGHRSLQHPVDALPGNLETAGDLSGCQTLGDKPTLLSEPVAALSDFWLIVTIGDLLDVRNGN